MVNYQINKTVLFLVFTLFLSIVKADDCITLAPGENATFPSVTINAPGNYCISKNIVTNPRFDVLMLSYRYSPSATLEINGKYIRESNKISINLKGFLLENNSKDNFAIVSNKNVRNVEVKNGSLRVSEGVGAVAIIIGTDDGAIYSDLNVSWVKKNYFGLAALENEDIIKKNMVIAKINPYYPSNNLVDHVQIRSSGRAIILGGGGNIVRNSVIETDGHTAVYIYGPNTVIENNTIIVNGNGSSSPFDAPIKIRDAKDSIIRNNKIIYKSFFGKHESAAVSLIDSENVDISNNVVEGFDKTVRTAGETSYSEKNNILNGR